MHIFVVVFHFAFSCTTFYSLKLWLRKRINIYKVCLLAAYPPVANLTFLPAMAMYFARKELGATAGLGGEPTHAPFTDLLRLEADTIDFALTGGPRVKSFVLHKSFPRTDIFSVFFCWHQDPCVSSWCGWASSPGSTSGLYRSCTELEAVFSRREWKCLPSKWKSLVIFSPGPAPDRVETSVGVYWCDSGLGETLLQDHEAVLSSTGPLPCLPHPPRTLLLSWGGALDPP